MKYFIKNNYGHTVEISKDKFYSLKRRKNAKIDVWYNNGIKVAKSISFKNF